MNEIFHTEDCAISLICRCCRAPVCKQRLAKADRMQMHRWLWPHAHGLTPTRQSGTRARDATKNLFGLVFDFITSIAHSSDER